MAYRYIISRLVATLFIALSGSGAVLANDYYLDATLGDDVLNDGSVEAPWQSLARVAGVLGIGDTVYLKRGETWKERLTIPLSGEPGLPITFTAYGTGAKPRIHGGRPVVGTWSDPVDGVYTITINSNLPPYFVIENDQMIAHASDLLCSDGNWHRVTSGSTHTLCYKPTAGTLEDNLVEIVPTYTGFQIDGKHDIVISDLNFTMVQRGIYGRLPPGTTDPVHDITISNCDFRYSRYGVIYIATQGQENYNLTMTGNTFSNNMEAIAVYSNNDVETSDNVTITDNLLMNGGVTVWPEFWSEFNNGDQEGIGLQNVNNSLVSRNRIVDGLGISAAIDLWVNNKDPGLESRGQNNEFSYNYIENIYGSGIVPGGQGPYSGNNTVAYNVIINTGTGPASEIWSGVWGALRLNTTQNPPSAVYNNVLVGNDTNIYLGGGSSNYVMNNNISYAPVNYHIWNHPFSVLPNTIDYNIFYPDSLSGFRIYQSEYDFAQWLIAANIESPNYLTDDPRFVDVVSNDLRLAADSSAIDAGIDVGATVDIDGNAIIGAADIGAYEYQYAADMQIAMTDDPDPVSKDAILTYVISVTNAGPDTARDIIVTDELPADLDNVAAAASQGTCDVTPRTVSGKGKNKVITPANVACDLTTLVNGANAVVTVTATVLGGETLSNTASVTGLGADSDVGNNSITVQTSVSRKPCKGKKC